MPTYQMSPSYDSTTSLKGVEKVYRLFLPDYVVLTFIMMLGFYILLRAFGISAWLVRIGRSDMGIFFLFLHSDTGRHIWKFVTLAYIPPTIAGVVLAYRKKILVGWNYYSTVYRPSDSVESHSDELLFHVCDPVFRGSVL